MRALGASQKIPFKVHRVDLQHEVAKHVQLRGYILFLHLFAAQRGTEESLSLARFCKVLRQQHKSCWSVAMKRPHC